MWTLVQYMGKLACLAILLWGALGLAEDRPVIWQPPAEWCCTLRDVASRLPKNTDAYDPDYITYGHEGSHFLAQGRGAFHGIYVGNGNLRYIPIPPLRLDDVFTSVPPAARGPIWNTYRKQGQSEYWRHNALMLCDEWVAYLRGSQIRQEMGITKRGETDRYCAEMAGYTERMYNLARQIEGYDHRSLQSFCKDILSECKASIPGWDDLTGVTFD